MGLFPSKPNKPALFIACTASLLIVLLAAGGPFFEVTRGAALRPITLSFSPGDKQLATSAGTFDQGAHVFKTTNTPGALVYGPYITLHPGHYVVSWTGTAGMTAKPRFEVFSVRHGMIASGTAPVSTGSGSLQRVEFDVAETVAEVELRVLVERGDELSIDGITMQFQPAKEAGRHE